MKKSVLSLAVAAGVSGVMSAAYADMYINSQGTGEALVYPFYSAQNGNDTYIHVVNTTSQAKAVKVRVLEAENSDEVLDFNLYMSPEDHFSFAITATGDGGAELRTVDESCTVPRIPVTGAFRSVEFRNFQYDDDKGETFDNTSISRTAIGYVEVIEMGQIAVGTDAYADLLHGPTGVPADCDDLVGFWSIEGGVPGAWLNELSSNGDRGISFFTGTWNGGGLYGFGTVINVLEGTAFGYDAVAIESLVDATEPAYALHYEPGDTRPDFTDSALSNTAIIQVDGESEVQTFVDNAEEIFAVNSLFMATEIINDYVVDPALAATTDWIITMPTKFQHVNVATDADVIPPFTRAWNGRNACEEIGFSFVNREEQGVVIQSGPDFSPRPETEDTVASLCYEMTVVAFAEESALSVDDVLLNVSAEIDEVGFTDGWATISFGGVSGRQVTPQSGFVQTGLPVTGFAAIEYTNGTLGNGTLANYAFTTEHKTTVQVSAVGAAPTP